MSDRPLTEKTTIQLSISSWWHVAVIIAVIVSCYFGLKADTDSALKMSSATALEQKATQATVSDMQMKIQSIADDVKWFRQQYERDANKYIREPSDRSRR